MIVFKPVYLEVVKDIVINTEIKVIKQVQKLKASGIYITSGLSNYANVNSIVSKVNYRLSLLKVLFKFTENRTKITLINLLIVSVFRYCIPLLIDSKDNMIKKLLMKCTKSILDFRSYKMSTVGIMRELNMITFHPLIIKEAVQFVNKILYNTVPKVIYKLFTFSLSNNKNITGVKKPMMAKSHISNRVLQSLFYR